MLWRKGEEEISRVSFASEKRLQPKHFQMKWSGRGNYDGMRMKGEIVNTVSDLGTNKKGGTAAARISKLKKLNGRSYKEWLNSLAKAKRSDPSIQRKRKNMEVSGNDGSEEDDTTNSDSSVSHTRQKRVDFLLKNVKIFSDAERSNISTQTKNRRVHISENQCNMDGSKLQENFTHSVENEHKSSMTKFLEYWVPVRLSNVQTELYCGSLFSNSEVLCTSSKLCVTETLREILVSTRKCCDHPKLVDSSMCGSLVPRIPGPENCDAEIKLSSKLLLLHKILQEISKRRLRVVILYRTLGGPGLISNGDILDDVIHEKFGEDSYVRIDEGLPKSNRRELLNTYNDQGSGKFICLMPTRACVPSVHLQSVDVVIFFNSDWDPMNDLRALQKIKLDSQLEHVKVFRLYSAFTVEEKLLMLTKQSTPPEGNIMNITRSTCHGLLTWGAYYLFGKLDEFHGSTTDGTHSITSDAADSFVEDVFLELSNLLPNNEENSVHTDSSFVVEVQHIGGLYPRNICVLGEVEYPLMKNYSVVEEMMLKEPAYVLWINLLQGRKPSWKYFSSQSPRPRKCVQRFDDFFEASVRASKKCKTEVKTRSVNELQSLEKESLLPGEAAAPTARQASNSRTNVSPLEASQLTQSQVLKSVKNFQTELERLQKQKTELLQQHEDKKLQAKMAREKEIDEINKKYDTMLQNAEMAFVEERKVLDATYNKVLAKKSSAEAMLQRENSVNADLPQGQHMSGASMNLISSRQLSEASPSIHLSASPPDPMHNILITFSGNIPPRHPTTAPAPHLRHMVRPLPSTPPLLPSLRPEISFSPVGFQQVLPNAQSRRSRL
ncbi:hypothetical protein ACS0TY_015062 [Phlomoides rotata]